MGRAGDVPAVDAVRAGGAEQATTAPRSLSPSVSASELHARSSDMAAPNHMGGHMGGMIPFFANEIEIGFSQTAHGEPGRNPHAERRAVFADNARELLKLD